jgi:hypothetical protein
MRQLVKALDRAANALEQVLLRACPVVVVIVVGALLILALMRP